MSTSTANAGADAEPFFGRATLLYAGLPTPAVDAWRVYDEIRYNSTAAILGDIIRVATDGSLGAGVLGRRELADPALRYEAGGNVAVFACRGANLAYGCHLTGLTPPADAPAVARRLGLSPTVLKAAIESGALAWPEEEGQ